MKETTHNPVPAPLDTLHAELRTLIASSRQRLAGAVNAELTRLYWSVGQRLRSEVLGGADRAKYGDQLISRVGDQLAQEFGRGFEAKNLRRMVQFAQAFPDTGDCRDTDATFELDAFSATITRQNRCRPLVLCPAKCGISLERARVAPPDRTQGLRAHRACRLADQHPRSG
jgi:hypothetical protein